MNSSSRPTGPKPPARRPKYGFGDVLKNRYGFKGAVDVIYADFYAALDAFAVREGWWYVQEFKPSSKNQVFYGINGIGDEGGAALVGEDDAEPVTINIGPPIAVEIFELARQRHDAEDAKELFALLEQIEGLE